MERPQSPSILDFAEEKYKQIHVKREGERKERDRLCTQSFKCSTFYIY